MKRSIIFILIFMYAANSCIQKADLHNDKDKQYDFVDSIYFDGDEHRDYVKIGFRKDGEDVGESIIVYYYNGRKNYFPEVLTCDECLGRGAQGTTYYGHKKMGRIVAFAQDYFNGRDSVFIDFTEEVPTFSKIIRRSITNEKIKGPDDAGNYLFTPKKKVQINQLKLPVDKDDPEIKKRFHIKPIKWRPIKD